MVSSPLEPQRDSQATQRGHAVPRLGMDLLHWLSPRPGESILDIGCGDGELTMQIAARQANVIGIDRSPVLLAAAAQRGLSVYPIDAHALAYDGEFDAVFSNAALHRLTQPEKVLHGVHQALRPGGRFVAEMGSEGNFASFLASLEQTLPHWGHTVAALNPWFFPHPQAYRSLLEKCGFRVTALRSFARPTRLLRGLRHWIGMHAGAFVEAVPLAQRQAFIAELLQCWEQRLEKVQGDWVLDTVQLRFSAQKIR